MHKLRVAPRVYKAAQSHYYPQSFLQTATRVLLSDKERDMRDVMRILALFYMVAALIYRARMVGGKLKG